eukprot:1186067-Prymnesium_polylepis.2
MSTSSRNPHRGWPHSTGMSTRCRSGNHTACVTRTRPRHARPPPHSSSPSLLKRAAHAQGRPPSRCITTRHRPCRPVELSGPTTRPVPRTGRGCWSCASPCPS